MPIEIIPPADTPAGKPQSQEGQTSSLIVSEPPSAVVAPSSAAIERVKLAGQAALSQAKAITVTDPTSLQTAADHRSQLKRAMDHIEGLMRGNIKRLYQVHKDAVQEMNDLLAPFKQADSHLKGQQDAFQIRERTRKEMERRRLEEAMEHERQRMLAEELQQAVTEATDPEAFQQVLDRAAEPPPSLPSVNRAVKAEGASVRWLPRFKLLDLEKVNPGFVMDAIRQEFQEKGECEWLRKTIQREVERSGKEAEKRVGMGSIEYFEEPSTGSRR